MIDIKLPCAIGMRIKDKGDNCEWRVVRYKVIGNGNPFSPSHRVIAEVVSINDQNDEMQIYVRDGQFSDCFEVLGY